MWIRDENRNTNVFHTTTKIRNHTNYITSITDERGLIHTERDAIENSFIEFYSNLWTEPMPNTFSALLQSLPCDLITINSSDGDMLIREVTREEVFSALNSLVEGKSQGPYGFNVEFFKFFWDDIAEHFFSAIQHFFSTVCMPRAWGKTFVTLTPKTEHPKKVWIFVLSLYAMLVIKLLLKFWPTG